MINPIQIDSITIIEGSFCSNTKNSNSILPLFNISIRCLVIKHNNTSLFPAFKLSFDPIGNIWNFSMEMYDKNGTIKQSINIDSIDEIFKETYDHLMSIHKQSNWPAPDFNKIK